MNEMNQRLLEAIAFAARAHRHQIRKDLQTPYVSHLFRVAMIVRHVFGVADSDVLTAAVLHDAIEDTTTDFDDIARHFGLTVAGWVAALTKDTRLEDAEREAAYCMVLANAPWQVRLCKLADVYDNMIDAASLGGPHLPRTLARSRHYLEALRPTITPELQHAFDLVLAHHGRLSAG